MPMVEKMEKLQVRNKTREIQTAGMTSELLSIPKTLSISSYKRFFMHCGTRCFLQFEKNKYFTQEKEARLLRYTLRMLRSQGSCLAFISQGLQPCLWKVLIRAGSGLLWSRLSDPQKNELVTIPVPKQIPTLRLFFYILIVTPERLSLVYTRLTAMRPNDQRASFKREACSFRKN